MKIGILVNRQYPFISANTAIAYALGEQLCHAHSQEITFIGHKQSEEQDKVSEYKNCHVRFLNNKIIPDIAYKCMRFINRHVGFDLEVRLEAKALRKIVSDMKINALICFCAPSFNASIVDAAKLDIPCILYQLDPYYNLWDIENSQLKEDFIRKLAAFKEVFTTELLYKIYYADKQIRPLMTENFSVAQFPKISKERYLESMGGINEETTRLLYAGTLYSSMRPPETLIALKKLLPEHYEFVYCGTLDSKELQKKFEDAGIICMGYCSQERLAKELKKADVLINIGNRVRNQLGSKLIEYISTGKPILNIVLIDECPTKAVLADYDLHFNVTFESLKQENETVKKELLNFISTSRGRRVEWNTIQKEYESYTIEYVTRQIQNALMRLVDDKSDN